MTPRYAADRPLPPYTYVPGRSPHPISDPAGHQYGQPPESADPIDADTWPTNRTYLFGLDLFNHGFYWEAHEAWEALWHRCGRKGTTADFLKGLIQLAATGVKHLEGTLRGVESHSQRAAELFRTVGVDVYLGLRIATLIELAEEMGRDVWPTMPALRLHKPEAV